MSLSRDQKISLEDSVENPTIVRKINNNEYSQLTKREWTEIFHSIDANIEYYSEKYDDGDSDWYRDLYSDTERLMKQSHPEWKSPATKDMERLTKFARSQEYCDPGYEWVPSYHKRDGTYVKGFCRKKVK